MNKICTYTGRDPARELHNLDEELRRICKGITTPAPGGLTTHVQFNNAGAFGGDANLTYDGAGTLSIATALKCPVIKPAADSTTALQIGNAAANYYARFDSTNLKMYLTSDTTSSAHTYGLLELYHKITTGSYAASLYILHNIIAATNNAVNQGLYVYLNCAQSSGSGFTAQAATYECVASYTGILGAIGTHHGMRGSVYLNSDVKNPTGIGIESTVYIGGTAGVTSATALNAVIDQYVAASTSVAIGIAITIDKTAGSIVSATGLLINNIDDGASINNAIYTNAGLVHFGDSVDLASGKNLTFIAGNIVTDTTTGTKIGTGATQKLGFWNATPVVKNTGWSVTAGYVSDKTFNPLLTNLNEVARVLGTVVDTLKSYGLLGA